MSTAAERFQETRAQALAAAAEFCAPRENNAPEDVLRIAEEFADYILTGGPHRDAWDEALTLSQRKRSAGFP